MSNTYSEHEIKGGIELSNSLHKRLDKIWLRALDENPCQCGNDGKWEQEIEGDIRCIGCNEVVAQSEHKTKKKKTASNMKLNSKQAAIVADMVSLIQACHRDYDFDRDSYFGDGKDSIVDLAESLVFELGEIDKKIFI